MSRRKLVQAVDKEADMMGSPSFCNSIQKQNPDPYFQWGQNEVLEEAQNLPVPLKGQINVKLTKSVIRRGAEHLVNLLL